MKKYLFTDESGHIEVWVTAPDEKTAYRKAWYSLTDEQQDNCAGLECVDEVQA